MAISGAMTFHTPTCAVGTGIKAAPVSAKALGSLAPFDPTPSVRRCPTPQARKLD
jgi:hypothetical protein